MSHVPKGEASNTNVEATVITMKHHVFLEALQYDEYHPNDELIGVQIDGSDVIIRIRPDKEIQFSITKMEKLAAQDTYIAFVFKDMLKRNPHLSLEEIWRPIFNANVVGDSGYLSIYAKL